MIQEESLSMEELSIILDNAPMAVFVAAQDNKELLYANRLARELFSGTDQPHIVCYDMIGMEAPCPFCCDMDNNWPKEKQQCCRADNGRIYQISSTVTEWAGRAACIEYLTEVTDKKQEREYEQMELYLQTLVKNLPGGITVIRVEPDGSTIPEFISEGFANMTHMTVEEVVKLYEDDIFAGIHPEDVAFNRAKLEAFAMSGEDQCEFVARFRLGDGGYIWVKDNLTLKKMPDGTQRLYCSYTDITQDVEEKERMQRQHEDLILQYYRTPGPDTLFVSHSNITQNKILRFKDCMDTGLDDFFGGERESFIFKVVDLVVDKEERERLLEKFLNEPLQEVHEKKHIEWIQECFLKLPNWKNGCYAQVKVDLLEGPDTGEITGILTVTDITEQTIANRILDQLSVVSHDYIVDVDLSDDSYKILSLRKDAQCVPVSQGCYSREVADMAQTVIAPRDQERYRKALDRTEVIRRLQDEIAYTITYSVVGEKGETLVKNMTISAIDLRLGRICLVCTDITESVREQQGLLNMIAYTFDLAGLVYLDSGRFVMYTREMVQENLPPHQVENYAVMVNEFTTGYKTFHELDEIKAQFTIEEMTRRLTEEPAGYDSIVPYQAEDGMRYKQVNVLWGDQSHNTICIVRADVTDILTAERQSQKELKEALEAAEKANRAKSEFLSSMSHDIRTPLNAIMGMTTLAVTQFDDKEKVWDCLQKITVSSKHLLSLVNDVLDMSKIEHSQIALNLLKVSLFNLMEEVYTIITPQAQAEGLQFDMRTEGIRHSNFYGDALRINQILINLLSNAVKFTQNGGKVEFLAEEVLPKREEGHVRYRFTVRDTGMGMTEEFKERVFAPFARDTTALQIEGTGLGLSITSGLVELMGGEIAIESKLGEGSVFRVELEFEVVEEAEQKDEKMREEPAQSRQRLKGRRFLAAEDNHINAEILLQILAMHGAQTILKPDGAQALEEFETALPGTYDAILLDIQMPVMNGYETARAIRSLDRPDAKTIPIVAMTANAFTEDIKASLEAGMNAHVAKPIDMRLLLVTLLKELPI